MATQKIGDKIYIIRRRFGLSQNELGRKVGVSRQTVSQWEANITMPKLDKLTKIGELFNMDINVFTSPEEIQDDGSTTDVVACDTVSKNSSVEAIQNKDVMIEEQAYCELSEPNQVEVSQSTSIKKLSKKAKITIASFVPTAVFICIVAVIAIWCESMKPKDVIYTAVSTSFNFGVETIAWLVLIFVVIALVILGIFLIVKYGRRKK